MAMYAKVRRMRLRDGLSISEIARRTSLSRNTVKTWLRMPVRSEMKYRRAPTLKKIGPYEAVLRDALAADARRPRRERRTARKLYAQLRHEGFGDSAPIGSFPILVRQSRRPDHCVAHTVAPAETMFPAGCQLRSVRRLIASRRQ
jgi:transcriptional regulator with XRE-family HTH domain